MAFKFWVWVIIFLSGWAFIAPYANAGGAEPNFDLPTPQLEELAIYGNPPAQFFLGGRYEHGTHGVPKNPHLAQKWYQEAFEGFTHGAQGGVPTAQFYLGLMYQMGHGVSINETRAASWYFKAADQGETRAVDYLWMLYNSHPSQEIYDWFQKAAKKGNPKAMIFMEGNSH